jgi:hypothetical protein
MFLFVSLSRQPRRIASSVLLLGMQPALAADPSWEGGVLTTWQHASDSRVRNELLGSADLLLAWPVGPGVVNGHLEANTTPRSNGVSSLIGEANADAGSALDADGQGRLQVSELNYGFALGMGELAVGLIDATGALDSSAVANDEATQFLATGLKNNASIEFPDYTLGLIYNLPLDEAGSGVSLVAAGSQGLSESADASHAELFDLTEHGRGAFLAAEWQRAGSWGTTRLGVWGHTAQHDRVDGSGNGGNNYGVYLSADTELGAAAVNLRLGVANEDVSEAARFAALAGEMLLSEAVAMGAGVAWTGASSDLAAASDSWQSEWYLRWAPAAGLTVGPSVQYLRNSGLDGSGASVDAGVWVTSLRLAYGW